MEQDTLEGYALSCTVFLAFEKYEENTCLLLKLEEHSKVTLIEYASCPINGNVFADHYFLKL